MGELGQSLFLESNTLTPLLKRMEAASLVHRRRDASDERVVRVTLSEQGAALAQELRCVPPQVAQATAAPLPDLVALKAGLDNLAAALRAATPES